MKIDCHAHTTASDGDWSLDQVIREESKGSVDLVIATDHDAWPRVIDSRLKKKIYGVEFTTDLVGVEVHVLGYFTKNNESIHALLRAQEAVRVKRVAAMVERIYREGINLPIMSSEHYYGVSALARALSEDINQPEEEIVRRYFCHGGRFWVGPEGYPTTHRVVDFIHQVGGFPVVAHPIYSGLEESTLMDLKTFGLRGMECATPMHGPRHSEMEGTARGLAAKLGLVMTGGSDWHCDVWGKPADVFGVYCLESPLAEAFLDSVYGKG